MEYTVNDMPVLLWQLEDTLHKSQGAGNQENKIKDTVRANRRTNKECVRIIQQFYVFSANTCTISKTMETSPILDSVLAGTQCIQKI